MKLRHYFPLLLLAIHSQAFAANDYFVKCVKNSGVKGDATAPGSLAFTIAPANGSNGCVTQWTFSKALFDHFAMIPANSDFGPQTNTQVMNSSTTASTSLNNGQISVNTSGATLGGGACPSGNSDLLELNFVTGANRFKISIERDRVRYKMFTTEWIYQSGAYGYNNVNQVYFDSADCTLSHGFPAVH